MYRAEKNTILSEEFLTEFSRSPDFHRRNHEDKLDQYRKKPTKCCKGWLLLLFMSFMNSSIINSNFQVKLYGFSFDIFCDTQPYFSFFQC